MKVLTGPKIFSGFKESAKPGTKLNTKKREGVRKEKTSRKVSGSENERQVITAYTILGLSSCCSMKEIKSRFRVLVKEFHPDTSRKETIDKFIQIKEAYTFLLKNHIETPQARKRT
jgi:hypothetical protein